ncbi:hypothetical protein H8B13_20325 [Hymenobacter sp. BT188]|uniref:DUF6799 domain-containing protein n=1 Tax=Hymenobacter TaxID=89966 RepID=UPI001059160E|nr:MULTISPECIES: DUF6799 domain-containing protein [Hymenobacter]MBC6609177.1 hypothetical protein [Hymenobacter sp. BT188]QIL78194.1 hypothetical protein G7064_20410 [Hymenobacter sp. HDW8]
MKKLPFLLFVFLLLGLASASHAQTSPPGPAAALPLHDYCVLKDGRMMFVQGGQLLPMTQPMTMRDGTVCRTNGSCTRKDGTVIQMKEGEHMMKNGKIMKNPRFLSKGAKAGA